MISTIPPVPPTPKRVIVQVWPTTGLVPTIALANDGTLWRFNTEDLDNKHWERYPDLPQGD